MHQLETLRDARRRKINWTLIAKTLVELEQTSPVDPNGQPWIRVAEETSDYSANHLRRMIKAANGILSIGNALPKVSGKLALLPFSHAEILTKLWAADKEKVTTLLKEAEWPNYPALVGYYEQARTKKSSPHAAGKLAASTFRSTALEFLKHEFGADKVIAPAIHHDFAKPDFIYLNEETKLEICAFDCAFVPTQLDREALCRRFVSIATESTYFDEFWLILSQEKFAGEAERIIYDLGLANVGLIIIERQSPRQFLRPLHGSLRPPVPDRRHSYRQFIRNNRYRMAGRGT